MNRLLSCPHCSWETLCGPTDMLRHLGSAGMVRRGSELTVDEMAELLPVAAGRLACPDCGSSGLNVSADPDESDDDWPAARRCDGCGAPIPPERLEVFPNAELCVACQRKEESGAPPATGEYCPRCGSPMIVRPTRGAGITRQQLACSDPSCRG